MGATEVTISLKDGRSFRRSADMDTMYGSPTDPLTEEELFGKFKSNAALILPKSEVAVPIGCGGTWRRWATSEMGWRL